jgi:iron complex transport system ATP-binding protein
MLSIAGVDFAYNGNPVLRDVTFEVRTGQMLAVLGINGAGKSTLLKCMNSILKPRKGCVFLNDRDIRGMARNETARYFGYVPQHREGEEMLVFDSILLGRKPHMKWGISGRDMAIVERIIQDMRLDHLALRPVNTLSGGEAQKVLIGRALAQEPEVLLLDEPTNSLDVKNQLEIMRLLQKMVKERDILAVVSIHDLNLALRFADRFLMLKDGSVFAAVAKDGMTSEVIHDVYGVDVAIGEVGGHPVAVPLNEQ